MRYLILESKKKFLNSDWLNLLKFEIFEFIQELSNLKKKCQSFRLYLFSL